MKVHFKNGDVKSIQDNIGALLISKIESLSLKPFEVFKDEKDKNIVTLNTKEITYID
jgi:hypothetical protein